MYRSQNEHELRAGSRIPAIVPVEGLQAHGGGWATTIYGSDRGNQLVIAEGGSGSDHWLEGAFRRRSTRGTTADLRAVPKRFVSRGHTIPVSPIDNNCIRCVILLIKCYKVTMILIINYMYIIIN